MLDMGILVITGISAVMVLYRGMAKEAITLLTWIVASVVALKYGAAVGEMFGESISSEEVVRNILGGVFIFIVILIIGAIINIVVSKFIVISGFLVVDKIFGAGFGILRSVIIIVIMLLLVNGIFENEEWWQNSVLLPKFQGLLEYAESNLPENWIESYKSWIQSYTEFTNNLITLGSSNITP